MSYQLKHLPHGVFELSFRYPARALVASLVKSRLIAGATCDEHFQRVTFKAHSATMLPAHLASKGGHLSIPETAKLLFSLGGQLKYLLEQTRHGVLGYSPDHVLVLNDGNVCMLVESDMVVPLNEDTSMTLCCPLTRRDCFFTPELERVTQLPETIPFKSAYYSLACLALFAVLGKTEGEHCKTEGEHCRSKIECLRGHPMEGSKLYFMIARCLADKVEERSLVWI